MTYSSRNFLISCGTGREERAPPRASNLLSSAMMSLQTSTHSSQMNTVGPAISFLTSFWSLLQNEQRRISPSPFFLTIGVARGQEAGTGADTRLGSMLHPFPDDVVNNSVFLALVGPHDVVALRVVLDPLGRLAGVLHQDLVDALAHAQDFLGRQVDVGGLAA